MSEYPYMDSKVKCWETYMDMCTISNHISMYGTQSDNIPISSKSFIVLIEIILLLLSRRIICPSVVQQSRIFLLFFARLALQNMNCLSRVKSSEIKTLE